MNVNTGSSGGERRPRVLLSAYAFGPCDESEANAAWAFAVAATRDHDVWVLTRPRFAEAIDAAVHSEPTLRAHLTVRYLDASPTVLRFKRGPLDVYWYYLLWQRLLARAAQQLHTEVGFDVAHHLTFASDWLPVGLSRLSGVPLVWGPVGGSTYLPWRMIRWVGLRGAIGEIGRSVLSRAGRLVWGERVARRAALVIGQNPDVVRRFARTRHVELEPNFAAPEGLPARNRTHRSSDARRAIFVGRLAEWKGARLAVSALARPEAADWTLDVYGAGRDLPTLRSLVHELALDDRVRFHGHRPRTEVLAAMAEADAMLFPSMHDSAGWVVGEASTLGCPVVCLDLGGPPLMAGPNGIVVSHTGDVVGGLARGLAHAAHRTGVPSDRWSATRLPELLSRWYATAVAAHQAPQPATGLPDGA